jgi:adenylate cyclase
LGDNRVQRRLAAILAADVAGYSQLMGADEEGVLVRIKAVRKSVIDSAITGIAGGWLRPPATVLLVEFASAVDAMRCAVRPIARAACDAFPKA